MSELALQRIREAKEQRLICLDLSNCNLIELPNDIIELNWLEELKVNGNTKLTNIEVIKHLLRLKRVYLVSTKIESIEVLSNLYDLEEINISHSKVTELNSLQGQYGLTKIILRNTLVTDLSPLYRLKNLKVIDISKCNIDFLNVAKLRLATTGITIHGSPIGADNIESVKMANLNPKDDPIYYLSILELNLSNKNVFILPNDLEKFVNLQKLDLGGNKDIDNISVLKPLAALRSIDLSATSIFDINALKNMKNLQRINLTFTKVIDLESLKELTALEYILISFTNIDNLSPLKNLKSIKELHMNSTKVTDLKPLECLYNLQKLSISSTNITDLSPLRNLENLKDLYITDCNIKNPPKEIADLGIESIRNYFKQIEKQRGTEELYEAKLIIVGEGGTGKTTLFEKLKDNIYQVGNTPETHGINIHEGLPFNHTYIGDNIFNANLWDFGGQELQYMTHQFFLTPRALYVLMMDARRESPNLAYWFKIISLLGRGSEDSIEKVSLILVFNKRGNTTGTPPQYQDYLKYYNEYLDVQYLEVDFAENDYRFDNLQNAIQQALVTLPIVKSQLPRLWKAVREDLREEAKTECYITTKRFSGICSKHGITEEADQWLLSGYLHQLGSLLHFQNDKGLRRLVILSPQWAVDGVYTFLSEESIARNNGRFTEDEFMALLATKNYNRDDADVILQLMTKNNFDICYEATEHNYVAAQLLPDNAPLSIKWFPKEVLQFRYQYPIMPKGLMSRLIVRLSDDIERDKASGEQIVWKKGVVLHIKLKEGDCHILLREDDAESKAGLRQILISVMGNQEARKYALRKVRDTVDDLHKKWFRSIKADEMVPCCCSECVVSDTPQLYKLENLLKLRSKGANIPLRCFDSAEEVFTQQLLEGVYDKGEIQDMENQGKY